MFNVVGNQIEYRHHVVAFIDERAIPSLLADFVRDVDGFSLEDLEAEHQKELDAMADDYEEKLAVLEADKDDVVSYCAGLERDLEKLEASWNDPAALRARLAELTAPAETA